MEGKATDTFPRTVKCNGTAALKQQVFQFEKVGLKLLPVFFLSRVTHTGKTH